MGAVKYSIGATGKVAPHWGAWIEIRETIRDRHSKTVAPHWGAWIEIKRPTDG